MGYEDEQRQWVERALASAPEITDEQRHEARRVRRHYARAIPMQSPKEWAAQQLATNPPKWTEEDKQRIAAAFGLRLKDS